VNDPTTSAIAAFVAGLALALLLAVPYIAVSYRRRGELGVGHALLALAFLVYCMALWTYTLLPFPDATPAWCAEHAANAMQTRPLQFISDIRREQATSTGTLLHNPAVQQAVFNVALFVPLGMFLRHLFRRGWLLTVVVGFAVSLFIECTQLTGVWYLFECPYRLFDVDDLITNTVGTALGVVAAPVLRLVPGQRISAPPSEPRPVTARRRLLGMAVDLLSVMLLGSLIGIPYALLVGLNNVSPVESVLLGNYVPALVLLYVVPLFGNGATFGQRVVLLRPVGPDGGKPAVWRMTVRFLVGSGGYFLLQGLSLLIDKHFDDVSSLLLLVSAITAFRPRGHRGLSGIIAGLQIVDSRVDAPTVILPRARSV
jgi:glycopeptide antibiotics resistance protein